MPFNGVAVIHAKNVRHPAEMYHFFTEELGCRRIQWLACAEPKDFCTTAPRYWSFGPLASTASAVRSKA